ncbi:DUF3916 domain-containing protein [Acetobacter cibinongensis]|uniref:Uncharacterized protein n=1 Tax=Acetobacter cibinongensis TaxID=146475 RepID=A0A1Z5YR20_9PROT|nr:DUF3916 domain-containing protein [Acetobacter cibinongensis]OUI97734.1 hypothetical protein HK14_02000 [Acetobacter cibinongensis]
MSIFEDKSMKNFIDSLYLWSSYIDEGFFHNINEKIYNDYISWKIPLPFDLLEDKIENKSIRGICVERMIWKLYIIATENKELKKKFSFFRPYCLITEPNFFGSEVGVFFSEKKLQDFLFRNINTKNYKEKTKEIKGNLSEKYNVIVPSFFSYKYFSHDIQDCDDDIAYHGGFHFLSYKY